jgi:protein phosphatase
VQYIAFGKSDPGKVRPNNEDTFICTDSEGFFMVADGMGGRKAGEVASAMTRDTLQQSLPGLKSGNVEQVLREAFQEANRLVREKADSDAQFKGMGCTCAVVVLHEQSFFLAHVGDSRIYLFRMNELKLVTRDHSYVEELFIRGLISEDEKADHPYRNQITRYIGSSQKLDVDITSGPVCNGDCFLVCSDGLSEEVAKDKMQELFSRGLEPQETAELLIKEALANGGHDNVTVVVVKVTAKKTSFFKKILGW